MLLILNAYSQNIKFNMPLFFLKGCIAVEDDCKDIKNLEIKYRFIYKCTNLYIKIPCMIFQLRLTFHKLHYDLHHLFFKIYLNYYNEN